MSKKRMIIFTSVILSVVVISLGIVKLYQTYALGNYIDTASSATFNVTATKDTSVTVPANGYSNVFYMVTNTSPGTVRYGVAYTTDSAVTVKTFSTSKDPASGMIEENEKKYVKLRLENTSSTVKNITLSTILGYTGGGELLPPNGVTLVTDIYNPVPLAQHITGLYTSGTKTQITNNNVKYNRVTSKNLINDRLGGTTADYNAGNIRYYGSNPNNYIYFNCSDYRKQNSNTCELWRIIGVFDGKVKIIRNESIGNLAWDQDKNDSSSLTTYDNDWSTSTSQRFLNNKYYNGDTTGTVTYYSGVSGGTSSSLNMTSIGFKNESTRNMIANTTLKIGGWSSYSIFPNQVYEYERGTTVYSGRPTTWYGKIGLMYLSDYGYATDIELCQQNLYNYENTNCKNNNWLFNHNLQWSIVHVSNSQGKSFSITSSGWVSTSNATYTQASIRPTIFLYENVLFELGTGTIDNPYKISSGTSTNLDEPIPNYTICYNANGGTGAPGCQTKTHNIDLILSTTKPIKNGNEFNGWRDNQTLYQPGNIYSENKETTLYADWIPLKYTLNLNLGTGISKIYYQIGNASNYTSSTSNKTFNLDYGTTYSYYGVASTGYTINSCTSSNPCYGTITGNIAKTLTANINNYNLTLNKGSGVSTIYYKVNGASSYSSTTNNISLSVTYGTTYYYYGIASDGYMMSSCTSSNICSGQKAASNETKNLIASPIKYTISYNSNGGTGSMSSHDTWQGQNVTIKNNAFVKTFHVFENWTTNSNGTNDGYGWNQGWTGTWNFTNGQYGISNYKLQLYAMWSEVIDAYRCDNQKNRYYITNCSKSSGYCNYTKYNCAESNGTIDRGQLVYCSDETINGDRCDSNNRYSNLKCNGNICSYTAKNCVSQNGTVDRCTLNAQCSGIASCHNGGGGGTNQTVGLCGTCSENTDCFQGKPGFVMVCHNSRCAPKDTSGNIQPCGGVN